MMMSSMVHFYKSLRLASVIRLSLSPFMALEVCFMVTEMRGHGMITLVTVEADPSWHAMARPCVVVKLSMHVTRCIIRHVVIRRCANAMICAMVRIIRHLVVCRRCANVVSSLVQKVNVLVLVLLDVGSELGLVMEVEKVEVCIRRLIELVLSLKRMIIMVDSSPFCIGWCS